LLNEFGAAFTKDLRTYIRYPAWMLGDFISTPLWFFFFALGVTLFAPPASSGPNEFSGMSFFYFGFIFIILFSTAVWGIGQSVRNEQLGGTLEQFFIAPASRTTLIVGRWARVFLTDAIVIGYTTGIIYLLGGGPITLLDPALFLFSLGVYELALIGFGLLFAGLTLRLKSYNTVSNLVFFGYIILCGTLFPITVLPEPVRYVSMAIPFTYFLDLMRHAALGASTIFPETAEYFVAVIMAVLSLVVGVVGFRIIERNARRLGSISTS